MLQYRSLNLGLQRVFSHEAMETAQLSEGERDVLLRVVGDTAHPALHLRDSLHQQVGVIAPQVVKHYWDAEGFGV